MPGVDDGKTEICRPNCPMMRNIAGHESVRPLGGHRDEVCPGTRDDCHPVDVGVPIAGDAQAIGTEGIRNKSVEDGKRGVEVTYPTNVGCALQSIGAKRLGLPEFEYGREGVGRASGGGIKVGVSHQQVYPHRDQAKGARLGRAPGQQPVGRLEEKRVIRHQQVDRLSLQGFDDLLVHLVANANPLDGGIEVAQLKPDRIP